MRHCTLFLVLIASASLAAGQSIRLEAPEYPPLTFAIGKTGTVGGAAVDTVAKLFQEANIPFSLKITSNYERALDDLKNGEIDGIFQAAKLPERDMVAEFIAFRNINWSWYFPKDSTLNPPTPSFKDSAKIGTVLHSSQYDWLMAHGYALVGAPVDASSLLPMLFAGRINVIFTSEIVFHSLMEQSGYQISDFREVVEVRVESGIYIAKKWINKNQELWLRLKNASKYVTEDLSWP